MTPDEIRVAIRMLDQKVYWHGEYPVEYVDGEYKVNVGIWRDKHEPIFDQKGNFAQRGLGHWRFRGEDFSTEYRPRGVAPK